MCRNKSSAYKTIIMMFESEGLDVKTLTARARLLLESYRHVCWASLGSCQLANEDTIFVSDEDVDHALEYLSSFSPTENKHLFERKLKALFDSRWMVELVDSTMIQVKEFPDMGELYFELLTKFYLTKFKYGESEMLELLKIERSSYYDRKKEALMVFALALWGTVLPRTQSILEEADCFLDDYRPFTD